MLTPQDVRALALSLPETEEKAHFDQPDFRVRNRIFVTLSTDGERSWIKVNRDDMMALSQSDPETYEARPWGASSWLGVTLSRVDPEEFRELVLDAWRGVAPKQVSAAFDQETGA
jgi:hypothetical protein